VGVRLVTEQISEMENPALRNPAVGSGTFGEPGAWRLQVRAEWGFDGDGKGGEFYPVHFVDDGIVRSKEAPPALDSFNQAIARYDRDHTRGGTYICSGLVVRASESAGGGAQVYTVEEGRARVWGFGIELPTSRRLSYATSPDLRFIDTEVHTADGSARQRFNVARPPIHSISLLRATLQKTATVVHGAFSGASDTLPDASVVSIVEVRQGETVFVQGTDYRRTGDMVDWSLPGNEPAPGSTYSVTYTYMAAVSPEDQDFDGFTVEGAVAGSSLILSYHQAVPRIDRLCMTQDGAFVWQRGVASEHNPRPPVVPQGVLALASIHQTWRGVGQVRNDGIRVTSFDEQAIMAEQIAHLYQEVARQRLEADISTRSSGARAGVFVDPLLNDEMRDQGIEQSAAIAQGFLTLPIEPAISPLGASMNVPAIPAFTPTVLVAQLLRTGEMKVNPYMSFGILPARVTLNPAIDQWTETQSEWTSPVTQTFNSRSSLGLLFRQEVSSTTQVVGTATSALEFLRQILVDFIIEGFGPGEILRRIVFDGVEVQPEAEVVADGSGLARGRFRVPERIPAGAKTVTFSGKPEGGSIGSAVFVGQGQLNVQTLRQVNTINNIWFDPLAQTFVLDAATQLCGVDLWFTAKQTEVRVQIREVQLGVPSRVVLAEAVVQPENIVVTGGGHTRVLFPVLLRLEAATEYAVVVLCNDDITALAIAELGGFDSVAQRWVGSKPYTVGVMLSSANASTWTAHQTQDLTFRLLEASFTPGGATVDMGMAHVEGATDMIVLAVDETPTSETRVEYELTLPDGNSLVCAQGQPVRLPAPISGGIRVRAKLSGTARAMPMLWPGAQLLSGAVAQEADYYSRSIPAIGANKAVLIYDAFIPSGASVVPEIQVNSGAWESMTQTNAVPQGNGVVEFSFEAPLSNADLAKVRFTLTGTSVARPQVSLIRFMAIK